MDKVKIEKLDVFGRGIARIDNKLCFISYALPDEICEIELVKDKKNYSEGKLINLITQSSSRIEPTCPYFYLCGGCHLMHLEYNKQLDYKKEKVKELLNRFGKIDIDINKINYDKEYNYRNKITLHVKNKKLGLYKEETNDLIEIDKCLLVSDIINNLITRLKEFISNYDNSITEIVIKNTSLSEVMLVINGECNKELLINNFKDINSIYLNDDLIYGKNSITEIINDLYFEVYPRSFFQVNYNVMLKMYNKAIDYYKSNPNLKVLDLYCGTGTIGISISKYSKYVLGIEVNSDAVISANKNKTRNNIVNIDFICGKVEDNIDSINGIDSIVVDPPRAGLDKYTMDNIIRLNPSSLIYISCDPVTLARDLNILKDNYNIKEIEVFDMFPNTYHVETVSVLYRKTIEK